MSEKSGYPHGTFSWIDLAAKDMAAAAKWYAEIFGWDYVQDPASDMPYGMFMRDGKMLCGLGELNEEMKQAGVPPMWNSYVNVDDAKALEAKVTELGGSVAMPTMQIADFGAMAFFVDPAGGNFGVWQPGTHKGAQLVNEDGAYTWNELLSRDVEKAKRFYVELFGWEVGEAPGAGGMPYTMFKNEGEMNAGMMAMPPQVPAQIPSYWGVYFQVADLAATVEKIKATGGELHVPPMEIGQGTIASVADPQGAAFSLIQPKG